MVRIGLHRCLLRVAVLGDLSGCGRVVPVAINDHELSRLSTCNPRYHLTHLTSRPTDFVVADQKSIAEVLNEFEDVPGTYFFNGQRSRQGYALNMLCMSLLQEANRTEFRANEPEYLNRFKLSAAQRDAILNRRWIEMLELGGNIYYTFKLAATDGMTFQQLAALQTGVTEDQYKSMMVAGGRSVEGNRSKSGVSQDG